VPHFEKMLYDQAQLVLAYLEAAQASGDRVFLDVAEDTLRYVQRDLTDAGGAFFSAEDADSEGVGQASLGAEALAKASSLPGTVGQASSLPGRHKSEGAFYLWTAAEIADLLGPDARTFSERFGVAAGGNALQDPHGEFSGRNILYQARSVEDVGRETGRSPADVEASLARSCDLLFRVRASRPRPHLDDKVLAAWNGLMIAAFARASRVAAAFEGSGVTAQGSGYGAHGSEDGHGYLAAARRAATFVRERMWDQGSGRLLRRYRDGEAAIDGYAEDYACLVFGLLELFQADGDPQWLEWATAVQEAQDDRFLDEEGGGWFATTGRAEGLLIRMKEDYDGAEPAASSVAAMNLLVLSHLGAAPPRAAATVERALSLFGPRIARAPRAVPMMLCVLSAWHAGMSEVLIAGPPDDAGTGGLVRAVSGSYQPFAVLVQVAPGTDRAARLAELLPWTASQGMRDGRPAAWVCRGFACEHPVTDADALVRQLATNP